MKRMKLLLLSMSLITVMTSSATARRHGRGRMHFSALDSEESFQVNGDDRHPARDRRHGRGFNGQGDVAENIPGYPMKGPASAPFVFPSQGRGGGPGAARDNFPGQGNSYRNDAPPHSHHGNGNNFRGNGHNPQHSNNFETAPRERYSQNPFLNSAGRQPGSQGNFAPRGPNEGVQPQAPFKPDPFGNINKAPALEPVTNELPTGETSKMSPTTTAKPSTINPREFDLLYGSNLHEENQTAQPKPQAQAEGKSLDVDPDFDTRILLDSTVHCQAGYAYVNGRCRQKV